MGGSGPIWAVRLGASPPVPTPPPLPAQHLSLLLASPLHEVVVAALQALIAFLKKTHYTTIRWHGHRECNARLLAMCQGWGGKEEVRGRAEGGPTWWWSARAAWSGAKRDLGGSWGRNRPPGNEIDQGVS